jgi:hypothetical protein
MSTISSQLAVDFYDDASSIELCEWLSEQLKLNFDQSSQLYFDDVNLVYGSHTVVHRVLSENSKTTMAQLKSKLKNYLKSQN